MVLRTTQLLSALCLVMVFQFRVQAQAVNPVAALTYVDLSMGSGISARYAVSSGDRLAAESERGYALVVSYFEPSRWRFHVGGRGGMWVSGTSHGTGSWRSYSAFAGPAISGVSSKAKASFDFSVGLLMASSTETQSSFLFSAGVSFSIHKYWMLDETFGIGPGVHLLLPLFGQVSNEGPEWALVSLALTWAEAY